MERKTEIGLHECVIIQSICNFQSKSTKEVHIYILKEIFLLAIRTLALFINLNPYSLPKQKPQRIEFC